MADAPGHEQYTRNMVTGASTADCAVIVVDASQGASIQTRRHCAVVALLGVRHIAVAVTKMDLVNYEQEPFMRIREDVRAFAARLGIEDLVCIPVSGLRGDNVISRSDTMPWYAGTALMEYLENVETDGGVSTGAPCRLWVQSVIRPEGDPGFRGLAGTVADGELRAGQPVTILPSGRQGRIDRIVTADGDLDVAFAGHSVAVTLEDDIDVSRGDLISATDVPAGVADQFEATIVWMSEDPLLPGRNYLMRIGTRTAIATVAPLKYKLGIDTLEHVAATQLELNEIGVCDLELSGRVPFDPYRASRDTGAFVLIDRLTLETVAAGMIRFALRRSENVHWQAIYVEKSARAASKRQRPCVVWLTGLSGAGKSTIANLVERRLHGGGNHTYLLDGDNVRHGLNKDLGFTAADRVENIRRVGEVAKLMVDAGLIVICSFISPFASERRSIRCLVERHEFIEVFVDASLEVAEARDEKGLYRKARRGELLNFTGIDSPYERPEHPEVHLDTESLTAEECADHVIEALIEAGIIER
jgi:bifunctional enzyme CysN/CysC